MGLIQTSHFKLWLAGNLRNWPLAEYQYRRVQQLPQRGGSGIYQNKGAGDVTDNDLTPKQ
jgi:hypothetical protein